ncbi:MAG: ATP-dependent DNA helicase RecG [Deltaproteobacteria bacterium]
MQNLSQVSIRFIKGIGAKRAKVFARQGIGSIEDFFYYLPKRYEDRTRFAPISGLKEGETRTIRGTVLVSGDRRSFRRRGFSITEALVEDDGGRLSCVWFNQPYLKQYLRPQTSVILYGKAETYGGRLQMTNPEFEVVDGKSDDEALNVNRIVPVYPLLEGLGQRSIRRMMKQVIDEYLPDVTDPLPYQIRSRNKLLNLAKSIFNIHFPESEELQGEAFQRLSFDEFLLFQLPLALRKARIKEKPGTAHLVDGPLTDGFRRALPFSLTSDQEKVLSEIKADMASSRAMQRLLQGDVGCGKTIVATFAAVMAMQGGHQAVLMAPTEILARQHYAKISEQLSKIGGGKVRVALFTAAVNQKEREQAQLDLLQGKVDLVIGTHALLEEGVRFKDLGLVVIDEQHKFGVGQRALLPQKGKNPDVLIMTATPIPRTLAITLYGDLDISVIRQMPPGRQEIKTFSFNAEEAGRAYELARGQIEQGKQAYIVFPVIEESSALDIAGAEKMYEQFKAGEFKGFRIALIHGRLKQSQQQEIMARFKARELDCLVATTVLEVGIDVPSATCMIVENAERFGLSQLHQLRGRVGRGTDVSYCLLISDTDTDEAAARMQAMVRYPDGFRIAEEDLKLRGPGEYFGSRQHGLAGLRIGNPLTQMFLLKNAREEALSLIAADPELKAPENQALREKLLQRFPEYEKLMVVG